jgi:hypothetical protein
MNRASRFLVSFLCDRIAYAHPIDHAVGRALIRRLDKRRRVFTQQRKVCERAIHQRPTANPFIVARLLQDEAAVSGLEYAIISCLPSG